jgi:hypothetical protein
MITCSSTYSFYAPQDLVPIHTYVWTGKSPMIEAHLFVEV